MHGGMRGDVARKREQVNMLWGDWRDEKEAVKFLTFRPKLLRHTKPITRLSRAYKNQTTEM